jgi:hypothetical protein
MEVCFKRVKNEQTADYWGTLFQFYKERITEDTFEHTYEYNERSYAPIPASKYDIELRGNFASSKYFQTIQNCIRYSLVFPNNLKDSLFVKYGFLTNSNCVIVQIKETSENGLPETYYTRAKSILESHIQNPKYVCFGENLNIYSKLFQKEDSIFLDESDITILYVMMHSKHCILANSFLSWWGAYLSNSKLVIVPKQQNSDLYEPNWIQLE